MDINVVHGYKNLCKHKPWLWESLQAHIDQADQKLSAACALSSLHLEMPPLQSVSAWASILGTDRLKILGIHNYIHKSDKRWYQNRDNLIPFWKSHMSNYKVFTVHGTCSQARQSLHTTGQCVVFWFVCRKLFSRTHTSSNSGKSRLDFIMILFTILNNLTHRKGLHGVLPLDKKSSSLLVDSSLFLAIHSLSCLWGESWTNMYIQRWTQSLYWYLYWE